MFAPAVGRPWRDVWPLAAQVGDGNRWVTGACWLYCRREGVPVLWAGSVTTPGATGDMYVCGPCLAELAHIVRVQAYDRDGIAHRAARPAASGTTTCEHRQIEERNGKTCCRDCKGQLYL
ncbi:hypothetical protein [Streptomyces coelicoflavus]|uniref:hypothetical protein n=1 Tax=Streptomyces coelicoflavus TaxID=285562 RepID=UPI002E252599